MSQERVHHPRPSPRDPTLAARLVVFVVLVAAATVHALFPDLLQLDWQALTLIILACLILGVPRLAELLGGAKFKVGEFELELGELAADLEQATAASEAKASVAALSLAPGRGRPADRSRAAGDGSQRGEAPDTGFEEALLVLAARDRQAAILRLGVEIDRRVDELAAEGAAPPADLGGAVAAFRTLRKRIAHGPGTPPAAVLTSAIDSGLRLVRLLRAARRSPQEETG